MDIFDRVIRLIGEEKFNKLSSSSVAIFGVGGVGGYVAEGLARSGIGKIAVIDNDTVGITNINRQIIASVDTIGENKVDVIEKRLLSINPNIIIEKYKTFYLKESENIIDFGKFDYIVDAVDTVSAKLLIIEKAKKNNVKVISSMGTAGKLDIMRLKVCDIKDTNTDSLARVMRRELKKMNIDELKVVYSNEEPLNDTVIEDNNKRTPPSMIFVPATAGLIIANEIIKDLTK